MRRLLYEFYGIIGEIIHEEKEHALDGGPQSPSSQEMIKKEQTSTQK